MAKTHWLCYASDGSDLGEICYNQKDNCYMYNQPANIEINIKGLAEIVVFMNQL